MSEMEQERQMDVRVKEALATTRKVLDQVSIERGVKPQA